MMQLDDDDLRELIGTQEYRNRAIRELYNQGRTAYGPIDLVYDSTAGTVEVQSEVFSTLLDAAELRHGDDGFPLVNEMRDALDRVVKREVEQYIENKFWPKT